MRAVFALFLLASCASAAPCRAGAPAAGAPALRPLPVTRPWPRLFDLPVSRAGGASTMPASGGQLEPGYRVIRDASSWRSWYLENHDGVDAAAEAPAIDFERDMVVVAVMAECPWSDYVIRIVGATAGDDARVAVDVRTKEFGLRRAFPADARPIDVVVLPRFDGEVSFRTAPPDSIEQLLDYGRPASAAPRMLNETRVAASAPPGTVPSP